MSVKKAKTDEIPEAKIRQAIWMLKTNKTKKSICEHLGIAYNTKRLDNIINDFLEKQERLVQLKKKAKEKEFTEAEKRQMAKDYQEGESVSSIAAHNYISSQKVKSFLLEVGVPIRARKKNAAAQTDHVVQDLDVKFKIGDRAFHGLTNSFVSITRVRDEEYVEWLRSGLQKYVETYPWTYKSKFPEPVEGIHYEIYWILEDGQMMKLSALKRLIKSIETHIEEYGREAYDIWVEGEHNHFRHSIPRHELFPVITK
jgi:hypothetical protein